MSVTSITGTGLVHPTSSQSSLEEAPATPSHGYRAGSAGDIAVKQLMLSVQQQLKLPSFLPSEGSSSKASRRRTLYGQSQRPRGHSQDGKSRQQWRWFVEYARSDGLWSRLLTDEDLYLALSESLTSSGDVKLRVVAKTANGELEPVDDAAFFSSEDSAVAVGVSEVFEELPRFDEATSEERRRRTLSDASHNASDGAAVFNGSESSDAMSGTDSVATDRSSLKSFERGASSSRGPGKEESNMRGASGEEGEAEDDNESNEEEEEEDTGAFQAAVVEHHEVVGEEEPRGTTVGTPPIKPNATSTASSPALPPAASEAAAASSTAVEAASKKEGSHQTSPAPPPSTAAAGGRSSSGAGPSKALEIDADAGQGTLPAATRGTDASSSRGTSKSTPASTPVTTAEATRTAIPAAAAPVSSTATVPAAVPVVASTAIPAATIPTATSSAPSLDAATVESKPPNPAASRTASRQDTEQVPAATNPSSQPTASAATPIGHHAPQQPSDLHDGDAAPSPGHASRPAEPSAVSAQSHVGLKHVSSRGGEGTRGSKAEEESDGGNISRESLTTIPAEGGKETSPLEGRGPVDLKEEPLSKATARKATSDSASNPASKPLKDQEAADSDLLDAARVAVGAVADETPLVDRTAAATAALKEVSPSLTTKDAAAAAAAAAKTATATTTATTTAAAAAATTTATTAITTATTAATATPAATAAATTTDTDTDIAGSTAPTSKDRHDDQTPMMSPYSAVTITPVKSKPHRASKQKTNRDTSAVAVTSHSQAPIYAPQLQKYIIADPLHSDAGNDATALQGDAPQQQSAPSSRREGRRRSSVALVNQGTTTGSADIVANSEDVVPSGPGHRHRPFHHPATSHSVSRKGIVVTSSTLAGVPQVPSPRAQSRRSGRSFRKHRRQNHAVPSYGTIIAPVKPADVSAAAAADASPRKRRAFHKLSLPPPPQEDSPLQGTAAAAGAAATSNATQAHPHTSRGKSGGKRVSPQRSHDLSSNQHRRSSVDLVKQPPPPSVSELFGSWHSPDATQRLFRDIEKSLNESPAEGGEALGEENIHALLANSASLTGSADFLLSASLMKSVDSMDDGHDLARNLNQVSMEEGQGPQGSAEILSRHPATSVSMLMVAPQGAAREGGGGGNDRGAKPRGSGASSPRNRPTKPRTGPAFQTAKHLSTYKAANAAASSSAAGSAAPLEGSFSLHVGPDGLLTLQQQPQDAVQAASGSVDVFVPSPALKPRQLRPGGHKSSGADKGSKAEASQPSYASPNSTARRLQQSTAAAGAATSPALRPRAHLHQHAYNSISALTQRFPSGKIPAVYRQPLTTNASVAAAAAAPNASFLPSMDAPFPGHLEAAPLSTTAGSAVSPAVLPVLGAGAAGGGGPRTAFAAKKSAAVKHLSAASYGQAVHGNPSPTASPAASPNTSLASIANSSFNGSLHGSKVFSFVH